MLDCEGAMSPEAGLVREELLIHNSEITNGKDKWKTTVRKRDFEMDHVGLCAPVSASEEEGDVRNRQRFTEGEKPGPSALTEKEENRGF